MVNNNKQGAPHSANSGQKPFSRGPGKNKLPRGRKTPPPPYDPYENRTGGSAIITKTPVWGAAGASPQAGSAEKKESGDGASGTGNNRRKNNRSKNNGQGSSVTANQGKNSNKPLGGQAKKPLAMKPSTIVPDRQKKTKPLEKPLEVPKTPNKIFDFSEAELAEDRALQVISRTNSEIKFANFEDFLKGREG